MIDVMVATRVPDVLVVVEAGVLDSSVFLLVCPSILLYNLLFFTYSQ